jgi:hypothetical protein
MTAAQRCSLIVVVVAAVVVVLALALGLGLGLSLDHERSTRSNYPAGTTPTFAPLQTQAT